MPGFALPQDDDPADPHDLPLAGVRVLDLATGDGEAVTRMLADLGADVLKIEPPNGSAARRVWPCASETSIPFALHNANKRSAALDPADDEDRDRFIALVAGADIIVDDGIPGAAASFGAGCEELTRRFGHLVGLSVTNFGSAGPHASWQATDAVLYAMSTALSRSGPPTGTPVLSPDGIASATAAVQAAWSALVAYVVQAITSTSPGSKLSCRRSTRRSVRWARARWRTAGPTPGAAARATRTCIRPSRALTGSCGSA